MTIHPRTSTLRLVEAAYADLEAIASLVNRAFLTHRLMNGGDRTSVDGLLEELGTEGRFILAESEGRLVGSAMIRPVNDDDATDGYAPPPQAPYFGLAAVEPSLMKAGIGRLLLGEAERIGRSHGQSHLALNTLYEFDLVPYYVTYGYAPVFDESFEAGHWGLPEPHTLCYLEKSL